MTVSKAKVKFYPQNQSIALCMPNWLIQIKSDALSIGAKMVYARLCQWAYSNGVAFRSSPDLAAELGSNDRQIRRYIKELKDVQLIGSWQQNKGTVNYYEFYEHEWMKAPIVNQLLSKTEREKEQNNPGQIVRKDEQSEPRTQSPNPRTNPADLNIKESKVKEISNIDNENPLLSGDNQSLDLPSEQASSSEAIATKKKGKKMYQETLYQTEKPIEESKELTIDQLLEANPFNIPRQTLIDWIAVRKKKKAYLSLTAWSQANRELKKLVAEGLDPIEHFELAVASGWAGFMASWFTKKSYTPNTQVSSRPPLDHDNTDWVDELIKQQQRGNIK